jgi:peptidoglycan/LPS O-acetylase OafA/YrhL
MPTPRWSTIGLFVFFVIQLIMSWFQARRTGKSFRAAVLPNALMAGALSIIFVREFFGDLPLWIDAPILILCCLIILVYVGLGLVRLERYLKEAWSLKDK